MEDPVVPLGRNLYGHLLTTIMGKAIWKVLLEHGWETILNWECLFVNRARGLFLSVYVDDIKLAGKTENIEPTWKIPMKDVDLGEPTSFLDSLYLGCTQRECQFRIDSVTNYSLNLYASWNAYGGNFLPIIHEDHVAGKGHHYNLVHTFIPLPQAMKIPLAKAAVDKEWEKLEKIPAWDLTKVRSKSEVIDEARTKGAKVHFVSLMDICHLKNAELETKHQKYKGRVVLRGDIVKDDSGSYAVFTEQGSSEFQMTAEKAMDIISRLPRCAGQAADAVSAYTQGENGRCSEIIENSQIGMSRHLDSSTTTQMA